MSSSSPQKVLSEKKKGKRSIQSFSPTIPLIPKNARTKIQARKESTDTRVHKKSKVGTAHQIFNIDSSLPSKTILKLIPEENLQRYVNEFLKKLIEYKYFIDMLDETKLGVRFLPPIEKHGLLNFEFEQEI